MPIVGRFAPSPSGRMHLGNVFTALLAWCSVRKVEGKMILRIEDLDPERCTQEYARVVREDLCWLGLDWDEEQTPQSGRTGIYERQFARLQEMDLVYPCYCSRNELHAASAPHTTDGRLIYSGVCRNLTPEQKAQQKKKPAWRIKVPEKVFSFQDGLQGEYGENLAAECGDFIVRRSDGVYAYQLAVVTDDGLGHVTQVVRGRDLLSSTPRQLYLYEKLGFSAPQFYHVPLLLAEDGRRLSKRDGDLDMGNLRERWSPEQLLGYLAALAGLLETAEPITARELAAIFSWERVYTGDIRLKANEKFL